MPSSPDIPPAYRALYDAAGPVVRYRIMRDVLGRDESYLHTADLARDAARLPEARAILAAQELDGSWSGLLCAVENRLATEAALLRLCELGLEAHDAAHACIEKSLMPTLLNGQILWETEGWVSSESDRHLARRVVRDKTLRLIARATRALDDVLKPALESLLAEWDFFLSSPRERKLLPPTADGYAAVCWFPWSDDDSPRVHARIARLFEHAERAIEQPPDVPVWFAPRVFQLADKWDYLARPPRLFHELELAARLGIARDLPVTRWLIEELEMRQDADGFCRFESTEILDNSWYFPLDRDTERDPAIEGTFRAALIFKLLEYDL